MAVYELTAWDRFTLIGLLGSLKGDVSLIRKAVKAIDALELSEAEKEVIGFTTNESGVSKWDSQKAEHKFKVEIKDREAANLLIATVKGHKDWPVNRMVLNLFDALGVDND